MSGIPDFNIDFFFFLVGGQKLLLKRRFCMQNYSLRSFQELDRAFLEQDHAFQEPDHAFLEQDHAFLEQDCAYFEQDHAFLEQGYDFLNEEFFIPFTKPFLTADQKETKYILKSSIPDIIPEKNYFGCIPFQALIFCVFYHLYN